ncbi:ATPase [Bacillus sp. FJAT-27916]|uniref:calcium-translocating P-type ATPase, SERCA-type n=1 Tax=Bacillaceae TaxID=186817 RepID=UPI00067106FF|nr:calcium-translocating P-type ATPase, SERCA-type [Bacillus sp. FJAT-27916]KMY45057.1 ATPase [Bacillus sp. FJAT-27916]
MKLVEMDKEQLQSAFNVDMKKGLSHQEAKKRLKQYGQNELAEGEKQSALILFFNQFKDFMVLILLAATLVSGLLGEYVDAIAIIMIVLVNGFLGFFQERKAEKSLSALKEMAAPQMMVQRDGLWTKVQAKDCVPGDIVKFVSGDRIGADIRITKAQSLEVEESALTGESLPVMKSEGAMVKESAGIGDQVNMAFMGTLVTRGSGEGVVVATGMKTAMGQIADLLQNAQSQQTPLQIRLEQLGKILIVAALFLTLLVVGIGVLQGNNLYTMVLAGVSLAVAAIPEGLPAIVTVALSLGVQRMIRKNAIVRKLPAVETLGCASVICSDKTGTMTENKMMVTRLWIGGRDWTVTGKGFEPSGEFECLQGSTDDTEVRQLLTYGILCNNAELKLKKKNYYIEGDPTEGAMLVAAMKKGIDRQLQFENYQLLKEFPFESERKLMSVMVKDANGRQFVITKGAPDVLLGRCGSVQMNGRMQRMDEKMLSTIMASTEQMAEQALRTIAVAYKSVPANTAILDENDAECELVFLGLQGMMDPPRAEVAQAVQECRDAGIKTVMITGDHMITAKAIGENLGIYRKGDRVISGAELDKMSAEDLTEVVEETSVFARVSPEHKLKIVSAFQERGHIVAMTGDGVNDAPAIKAADIGIAMGISGTDVAKETSSLILLDDNFATIKAAIKEGRNIYENIRKFIRYLLASNVGEILVMLFAMIIGLPLPLLPIQILWVNLVTDGLPAMALGLDQPEENVMKRPPRHPKEGVFARGLGWKIISRGFLIGSATLLAFVTVYKSNPDNLQYAQTVAFATLVLAQLIHVFDCRSEKSIFSRNPFGNKYLVWAVLSSIALMVVALYYPPLQAVFHTVSIEPRDWLLIVGMASIPTFLLAGTFYVSKSK